MNLKQNASLIPLQNKTAALKKSKPKPVKRLKKEGATEPDSKQVGLYNNLAVFIHTRIADPKSFLPVAEMQERGKSATAGRSAVMLWYLVRAIDIYPDPDKAKGWVDLDIKGAAESLKRTYSAVRQYLHDGIVIGLFRNVIKIGIGKVRIYYTGRDALCIRHGLKSFGEVAEVDVTDLPHLKVWATQITMQALQQVSKFLAQKEIRQKQEQKKQQESKSKRKSRSKKKSKPGKEDPVTLPDPEDILSGKTLHKCRMGNIHLVGPNRIYVSDDFPLYGVSQQNVGTHIGRCTSTVKRRLSNSYRRRKGIELVTKRQLAKKLPTSKQFLARKAVKEKAVGSERILLRKNGIAYHAKCNIYGRAFDLKPCSRAKSKYRSRYNKANPVSCEAETPVVQAFSLEPQSPSLPRGA